MSRTTILIVEDDEFVRNGLSDILTEHEYNIREAAYAEEGIADFNKMEPDLVIIDINLGKKSGFELCRQIRLKSEVPIIFLTAYNDEVNLVRGFNTGADDYITKPFRLQELLVRINALLRRNTGKVKISANEYASGDIQYRIVERKIEKNNEKLYLTPRELQIVDCLIRNYPNTVVRSSLLYNVWDKDGDFVDDNTLNVHMSRLREKLGTYQGEPYIKTVRGTGYVWGVMLK